MSFNINAKTDYSTLFSGMNNTKSKSALSDLSWLSEYASIKSGSYGKLMKAYYSSDTSEEVSKIASNNKTSTTVSDEVKAYNKISADADALQSSIKKVQEIGEDKDLDELYSAVNSFVKDYNSLISSAQKADDSNINERVSSIKNYTASNTKTLNELGISVDKDGKLSLDKDTFAAADKSSLDTLFASRGSYAYGISVSAGMAQSTANFEASKESTYTSSGTYNAVTGSLWDSTT